MWPDSLAVLGLGALGGSLAWQARQAGVGRVIGYSATTADASQALRAGAITDRAESVSRACRGASLVAVTGSPDTIRRSLAELGNALDPGAIVTDLAPLRRPVSVAVGETSLSTRHAGSYPVITARTDGFHGASPTMFRGAMVYVCQSSPDDSAARVVSRFWSDVMEAQPVTMSAEAIDRRTAWRLQLPALIGAALARAQASHGPAAGTPAAPAQGEEVDQLSELLLANRAEVLRGLEALELNLAEMRGILAGGDRVGLRAMLQPSPGVPGDFAR
jgi:prephenate dehydrogenase